MHVKVKNEGGLIWLERCQQGFLLLLFVVDFSCSIFNFGFGIYAKTANVIGNERPFPYLYFLKGVGEGKPCEPKMTYSIEIWMDFLYTR